MPKISDLLEDLKEFVPLTRNLCSLQNDIDFDFFYDVAPEHKHSVKNLYTRFSQMIDTKITLEDLNIIYQKRVFDSLKDTPEEINIRSLTEIYGFEPPRRELFRVDFEFNMCLLLRHMKLNANKYQGSLTDRVSLPELENFVENNPDVLVTNGILFLVECKSRNEWPPETTFNKRILGEISIYQEYADQVRANCAIILTESLFTEENFYKALRSRLRRLPKVVLVNHTFLLKALADKNTRNILIKILTKPTDYKPADRILVDA